MEIDFAPFFHEMSDNDRWQQKSGILIRGGLRGKGLGGFGPHC